MLPEISTVGGAYTFHAYTGVTNTVLPVNNSFTTSVSLLPCTGIEDIQSLLGFSIYPNPSNGIVVIDFSEKYSKTAIEIINSTGAVVKNILVNNTVGLKIPIELSPFSKGIYLFKVITDDGFDVRRIILE